MGWLDALTSTAGDFLKNNAGSIASGVAGAVLGSGTSKGNGSSTTSITSVPAWLSDYAQQLLTQANMVAAQPYQQYAGPRVAGQTQDQLDAANMIRNNTGQAASVVQNAMGMLDPNAGQGMLTQAGNYLSNAGGSWLDNSGKYMADYTTNVTNPAVAQAMKTWNEQINPGIQSDFSGAKGVGAFGSDAMLRQTQRAGTNLSENLANNMAAYLDKGYTTGMGQFNTQNNQQGQLAQIAASLGKQQQDMNQSGSGMLAQLAAQWAAANANDANSLNAIGLDQRNLNQKAMDIDYGDWSDAKNYSKDQLNYLQQFMQGNAGMTDKTTTGNTSTTNYTSPLQAATQGYSLYNALMAGNPSNSNPNELTDLQLSTLQQLAKNLGGVTPLYP